MDEEKLYISEKDLELETEMDEEEDEEEQSWDDWEADKDEEDISASGVLCLFCDSKYSSCDQLFEHCTSTHHFDFHSIRKGLGLDFYGSFKLINYVRSQVAEDKCWSCRCTFQSRQALEDHLHEPVSFDESIPPWDDNKYLMPFIQEDPLLYNFYDDNEGEDEDNIPVVKEELSRDLSSFENICLDDNGSERKYDSTNCCENGKDEIDIKEDVGSDRKPKDQQLRVSFAKNAANQIKNVNESYFGSYSSFGIHREMISDKVRTDAYRQAIMSNPSLLTGATVLDVGCGTGILSLFASQAGASKVIAVEGSEKMASVATQIAKDNGLLWSRAVEGTSQCTGVIRVVNCMAEELDDCQHIQPQSVDVLVSEWMGYCLLYESMLGSVLHVRDRWLKPGGAVLPDTATMYAAGFGKGGTSIPFWENVYGFNMSCIGKEIFEEAAQTPIVDVVESGDIVTNSVVLQTFDLVTMKLEDVDFTASIELQLKGDNSSDLKNKTTWCYGVVLWFDTGFTSRFCVDSPVVLSTSPYNLKTHWCQTILTFREPIAMDCGGIPNANTLAAAVGTDACPAVKIQCRISIVRGAAHRSIEISLETAGIGPDGRKRDWPVQVFNLL